MKRKLLIIKLGETFTHIRKERGDFDQWLVLRMSLSRDEYQIYDCLVEEGFDLEKLLDFEHINNPGAIILYNFKKLVFNKHQLIRSPPQNLSRL